MPNHIAEQRLQFEWDVEYQKAHTAFLSGVTDNHYATIVPSHPLQEGMVL